MKKVSIIIACVVIGIIFVGLLLKGSFGGHHSNGRNDHHKDENHRYEHHKNYRNGNKNEQHMKLEENKKENLDELEKSNAQPPKRDVRCKDGVDGVYRGGNREDDKEVNRISQLFSQESDKLPIVETIEYASQVPWLQGRPAWISDYALHYHTSRYFIARSLSGGLDDTTQQVVPGDRFNVFRLDKEIQFYALVNVDNCTMDLYYLDFKEKEQVFLRRYDVVLGKRDVHSSSGSLTPQGRFILGSKIAVYSPGMEGYFDNQKVQMMEVFGTRWIPFENTENVVKGKGLGIHGIPCKYDAEGFFVEEMKDEVGDSYYSDGCLWLRKADMEEFFAIVITKPTIIEIISKNQANNVPVMTQEDSINHDGA